MITAEAVQRIRICLTKICFKITELVFTYLGILQITVLFCREVQLTILLNLKRSNPDPLGIPDQKGSDPDPQP